MLLPLLPILLACSFSLSFSTHMLLLSTFHFPLTSIFQFPTHLQHSPFTYPPLPPTLQHLPRPHRIAPVEVIAAPPLGISFIQFLGEIKHFYTVHNGVYGPNTGFDSAFLLFIIALEIVLISTNTFFSSLPSYIVSIKRPQKSHKNLADDDVRVL